MSFINKKGKTSSWRKMVIRQQVSDVIAYGQIITTLTKAKETQKHVDDIITLAKNNNLASDRKMRSIFLKTTKMDVDQLVKRAHTIAKKYENRKGGYTRVVRLDERDGDNTVTAVLQLV